MLGIPEFADYIESMAEELAFYDVREQIVKEHSLEFRHKFLEETNDSVVVMLEEPAEQHKLYLHVYDANNRHVGFNHELNKVDVEIPEVFYIEYAHGTIITLPSHITNFRYVVDAKYAERPTEEYNITITINSDATPIAEEKRSETIQQGVELEFVVQVLRDDKEIIIRPKTPHVRAQELVIIIFAFSVIFVIIVGTAILLERKHPTRFYH